MRKIIKKALILTLLLLNTGILAVDVSTFQSVASLKFVAADPEHDLKVVLEAPNELLLGYPTLLNVNVTNIGLVDETNVTVVLLKNGTVLDSKSFDITVGSTSTFSKSWTPTLTLSQMSARHLVKEASYSYNITAYAAPVGGETSIENNVATKMVKVWNPVVYIDPPYVEKDKDQTLTISLKVANLTSKVIPLPEVPETNASLGNLFGFELKLSWDPTILQYISHIVTIPVEDYPEGVLNEPVYELPTTKLDITAGTYCIAYSSMAPYAEPFNNPGASSSVFNMTFKVLKKGGCLLRLTDTELSNPGNIPKILPPIIHARSEGLFETLGAPRARFTFWPPDKTVVNKTMIFNATTSFDDGTIVKYMWVFEKDGPEENTTDPIIEHNYTKTGVKEVTLRVLDNEGWASAKTIKSVNVVALRNIAVTKVEISSLKLLVGLTLRIDIVVKNNGSEAESFAVSAYYNKTAIDTATQWVEITKKDVAGLMGETTLALYWNTTGVTPEIYYYVLVNASLLPHEDKVNDNSRMYPNPVLITAQEIHDIVTKSIEIKVRVGDSEFELPVISGENATTRFELMANGTVAETFGAVLDVVAPNGTVLYTKTWEEQSVPAGETKELDYKFDTKDFEGGSYKISVNATIAEEDAEPGNDHMETTFVVIEAPNLQIAELPSRIYDGDNISFDARGSSHPGGEIVEYKWTFSQAGLLKWIKTGSLVNATFDATGKWKVVLNVKDSHGIEYHSLRPATKAYQKELSITVEGRSAFPMEIIYAITGIVVIAIVGVVVFLRFRKPKSPKPT